jgi:hypothetical protein
VQSSDLDDARMAMVSGTLGILTSYYRELALKSNDIPDAYLASRVNSVVRSTAVERSAPQLPVTACPTSSNEVHRCVLASQCCS